MKNEFITDDAVILKRIGMSTGAASSFTDGDALVGIDEQPFPVEGDDLDVQRFGLAGRGRAASMRRSGR